MGVLAELASLGVHPELEGDRFACDARTLTDATRALLRARRDEVMAELLEPVVRRTEALALALAHLPYLPVPTSLVLAVPEITAVVVWTTSRARHAGSLKAGEVAFAPSEFLAMANAFESDRHVSGDLTAFCTKKLRTPEWRLTELVASNGVLPKREPWRPAWYAGHEALDVPPHEQSDGVSVGRLLAASGARLVDVVLEDEQRSAA